MKKADIIKEIEEMQDILRKVKELELIGYFKWIWQLSPHNFEKYIKTMEKDFIAYKLKPFLDKQNNLAEQKFDVFIEKLKDKMGNTTRGLCNNCLKIFYSEIDKLYEQEIK